MRAWHSAHAAAPARSATGADVGNVAGGGAAVEGVTGFAQAPAKRTSSKGRIERRRLQYIVEGVAPLRRERVVLLAILLVAAALRLGYVLSLRGDVLFEHPILDEQHYVADARALADGRAEDAPYWQPPGIIYFLAACVRLFGAGLTAPRVVQALISTAACLLVFAIGRRLFGAAVALGAAAIVALHGVVIFESAELLPPTFILALDLAALWWLLRAQEDQRARTAFAAGITLGVSALFAPTVLPFAAAAALWLRRGRLIVALALGVLLPIAPVTARNHAHGGEWVLVSTNGGLNFFIGNNARYAETFALRPGRHWEELTDEPRRAGVEPPGARSAWFAQKGWAFFRERPVNAAALVARKLYLFFNGGEIPRDSDLYAARADSRLLAALVWPGPLRFPDGVVIPLALVGAALAWRERKRLALLYAFLAVQALIGCAFFVTARHRVPALAVFALFAAAGAAKLKRRPRALAVIVGAALAVVLNLPTRESSLSWGAEADFYRGVAFLRERRDPATAADYFRRAAARAPGDARAWFELGNALDASGRGDEAVDAWRRAAAADPWDVRPLRRASMALARRGDLAGAIAAVEGNLAAKAREDAVYAPDWLNLAFLRARTGQVDRAVEDLRSAARADANYFRRHAPGLPRADVSDARFWQALDELLR